MRQRDEVLCADLKESGCSLVSLWTPSYDSHLYIHHAEREAKDSYRPRSLRSGEGDCLAACASFFGLIFVKMVQKNGTLLGANCLAICTGPIQRRDFLPSLYIIRANS